MRPPRRVWALGALAFACLVIEGGSADWSGVYIKDELGTGPGFAALGFTAFSVTMTLGRIFGDRLVMRFGGRRGWCASAASWRPPASASRSSSSSPAAALIGFACLGAGMSSVVPIVFRAAGSVPGIASSVALSAVSSVGYLGFVAGPPAIGGIAELIGLPRRSAVLVAARRDRGGARRDDRPPPRRPGPRARGARASRGGGGMTVVLSDLDGVLVDSQASIMRAWQWWGERNGVARAASRPSSTAGRRARSSPRSRRASTPRPSRRRSTGARPRTSAASSPTRARPTCCARFGPDRIAVVTSCTAPLARARLRAAGLPVPAVLVTADRLTRGKPDPEGYLLAARELGADPADCVVIEDAPGGRRGRPRRPGCTSSACSRPTRPRISPPPTSASPTWRRGWLRPAVRRGRAAGSRTRSRSSARGSRSARRTRAGARRRRTSTRARCGGSRCRRWATVRLREVPAPQRVDPDGARTIAPSPRDTPE